MADIITVRCPSCGNTYNLEFENGNTFKCSHCGNTNLIRPNLIHNPYRDGYEEERGRIDARREEQKAIISQTDKSSSSAPHKKPVAGRVIAIIACVVFATQILPMFITLIIGSNTKASAVHEITDTRIADNASPYTNPRSERASNDSYNEGVTGCSFPVSDETSAQVKWVYLTDLPSYSGIPFSTTNRRDIFGNEYSCSFSGYRDEDYAIWRLNKEYSTLTFTIGVPSMCRGSNPDWYSGSLKVYCDDQLVYEKSGINSLSESESVAIDVSDVVDVKIEICADYGYLEPTVFNPILHK